MAVVQYLLCYVLLLNSCVSDLYVLVQSNGAVVCRDDMYVYVMWDFVCSCCLGSLIISLQVLAH